MPVPGDNSRKNPQKPLVHPFKTANRVKILRGAREFHALPPPGQPGDENLIYTVAGIANTAFASMAEPKENAPAPASGAGLMEKIVSLCKRRGFIYQSSEIYGGINGFWDYGPLGAELKRNVKELWWRDLVQLRDDVVGLEATIIMHPQIWKASGHVDTFSDPMCDCRVTGKRFRADQVEPQSGKLHKFVGSAVFKFSGAIGEDSITYRQLIDGLKEKGALSSDYPLPPNADEGLFAESEEPFSVLLPKGKPPEAAIKVAKQFYERRGLKNAEPILASVSDVENDTTHNPENGAELTPPRPFNLMFKTYVGPVESEDNLAYLRPETAQAIFAQFKNVLETSRQKVPFGIAQIGKAFRNEVTPRNYTFRSREFEQMELEYFIKPDEVVEAIQSVECSVSGVSPEPSELKTENLKLETSANWGWREWHKYWVEERIRFYESIGLPRTTLEEYWQKPEELAHYARVCVDILFKFPFGTQELEGVAARGDFDLSQHERFSGKPMGVFDEELRAAWGKLPKEKQEELWRRYYENRKKYLVKMGVAEEQASKDATEDANGLAKGQYLPHVIEPSAGVDRLILALICHAYCEDRMPDEKGKLETRVVLKFHPRVAPIKAAVLPLLKNKPELVRKARQVHELLRPHLKVFYDDAGAIGRRYRRQDEAGTPFCVTVDFDTLGEKPELKDTVTVRYRDDGKQERVAMGELLNWLLPKIR
jgi:glycyl-tRNA synthetase